MTVTVDPDGTGDYLSLNAWESGSSDPDVICTSSSGSADTTAVSIDWSVTVTISADSGHEAKADGWYTSRYRLTTDSSAETLTELCHVNIYNLQIRNTSDGYAVNVPNNGLSVDYAIDGCRLVTDNPNNNTSRTIWLTESKGSVYIINCVVYGPVTENIVVYNSTGYMYNSTIYGGDKGVSDALPVAVVVKNCAVFDNPTANFNDPSSYTIEYCASDSGEGTNAVILDSTNNYENEFTDVPTDDVTLVSGSGCVDAGTDLSAEMDAVDIVGTTRPQGTAWDIGAFEYVSSGTVITVADSGSGADAISQISANLSVADSGSGVEELGQAASLTVLDVGTGADTVQGPSVTLTVQDTASAVDTVSQILAALTVVDTGAGTDSISVDAGAIAKLVTDAGTGVDSVSVPSVELTVADTATGQDLIGAITALLTVQDSATAAELINVIKTKIVTVQDTGTGTDLIGSVEVSVITIDDVGIGNDLVGNIGVSTTIQDTAQALDTVKQVFADLTVVDTGVSTDSVSNVSVAVTVSDMATALDTIKQVTANLTVTDAGAGVENITAIDLALLPEGQVKITFTAKSPNIGFTSKKPNIGFTSKKPKITIN